MWCPYFLLLKILEIGEDYLIQVLQRWLWQQTSLPTSPEFITGITIRLAKAKVQGFIILRGHYSSPKC